MTDETRTRTGSGRELALVLSCAGESELTGLFNLLREAGFDTTRLSSGDGVDGLVATPRLAVLDLRAPAEQGISILNRLSRARPGLQAVMLGHAGGAHRSDGMGVIEFDQTVAFDWLTSAWHLDDLAELEYRLQVMRGLADIQPEALASAIESRQFELHYQPIYDIRDACPKLVRAEALLRWNHPRYGLLLPGAFWGRIEEAGLSHRATDLSLALAGEQLVRWRAAGVDVMVAVNIAPDQLLDPRFPRRLSRLTAKLDLPPGALALEVTEAGVMSRRADAVSVAADLIDRGFRLYIDQFGESAISFRQVMTQRFAGLKIHGGLIREVRRHDRVRQLVRGIIHLAHDLGMQTTAKNIETEEMLFFLKGLGCDEAQGWYLGGAVPADRLGETPQAAPRDTDTTERL